MLEPDPVTRELSRVKIIDFGIAKFDSRQSAGSQPGFPGTRTGAILGTPMYMAPEQIGNAKTVDGRADTFSLGAILYHLLVGRLPYVGSSAMLATPPPPPVGRDPFRISPALAQLVSQMMSPVPEDRPPMADVASEFASLQACAKTSAGQPASWWWRPFPLAAVGACLLLNVLVILLALLVQQARGAG